MRAVGQVATILADSGVELSPEELLDTLWLAGRLRADGSAPLARAVGKVSGRDGPNPDAVPGILDDAAPASAPAPTPEWSSPPKAPPPPPKAPPPPVAPPLPRGPDQAVPRPPQPRVPLHAAAVRPSSRPGTPVHPVSAPTPRAARFDQLQLGRSLRPLKLRVRDPRNSELDETATAEAAAETGLPDAVLRPSQARWLDVTLLVDDGTSMLLWQRLASEVKSLLERSGAFRTVRVLGLDTRGSHAPRLTSRPFLTDTAGLPPSTVTDTTGRTLVLVVSDGVGAAWRDGRMRRQLGQWGRYGPTAVLHALPPHLWEGSGLRAARWRVTTRRRGAPNHAWEVADPVLPPELAVFNGVEVPVLAPDAEALGAWASLLASPGTSTVLPLLSAPSAVRLPNAATGAAQAVLRFRETASPEAYRLAAHLAAMAPVSVPVMRLVQQVLGPRFDTGHLAEVFLGGLMRPARAGPGPLVPQHRRYDFCEQARDILLGTAPAVELLRTGRAVADRLARLVGRSPDFPAWLAHPDGTDEAVAESEPFGWIDRRLLRRLGVPPDQGGVPKPGRDGAEPVRPPDEAPDEPPPAYVDAPGSPWLSLGYGNPVKVRTWQLFARHKQAWPREGMFLGRDDSGRTAAIRLKAPQSAQRAPVKREADALRGLKGRGAPELLDLGGTWTATELLLAEGDPPYPVPSLAQRVELMGPLPVEEFVHVAHHAADVLAHAHARGIVHGGLTALRILPDSEEVCITGWGADEHSADRDDDIASLGSLLLEAAGPRLGPGLSALLERCRSPVLADRPSAAHLAMFFRHFGHQTGPPPAVRSSVSVGVGDDGEKVTLDFAVMGPHGSVQGPFAARAALLYVIVNGMARRMYAPDEVRFVLVGDARLYLEPRAARDLRQVVFQSETRDVDEALGGELRLRRALLDEAGAAGRPRPALAPMVVVTEAQDPETTAAWRRALPPELGVHLLVLEGAADPPTELGYRIMLDDEGAGSLTYGAARHTFGFRRLLSAPRVDQAAKLTDEQRQAVYLGRNGGLREAVIALQDIAVEQRDLLGPNHPDTLSSHYEIGTLYLRWGRYGEALDTFAYTAARRVTALGPGHPDTLNAHQQRAHTLNRLGRTDEAYAAYCDVLDGWLASVGEQHPATLLTRHSLAITLIALERYDEALRQAHAAHRGRVRILGDGHPSTMASAHELAIALFGSGREEQGTELARNLYMQRVRVLGADHEDTLATRRLLGDNPFPEADSPHG
ncbi:tetratricopeptide repeat-containing protein kinase family protein [Streptomyces sp. PTD9-10]|uniref:tetratricopeptide repeat-containing protein kinase family protein n=1 Tax=Streptomyces sp. PTD9-10 TaxID=3120151 RepID=UPI0030096356